MAIFQCKVCGGTLAETANESVFVCEYCGREQTVSKSNDEEISNLFNRANDLRRNCNFDKAEKVYEMIVERDDTDAEAHWGIVLCRYGIEYVKDPATGEYKPTCHFTQYDAVKSDVDYQAAIRYADPAQKALYEAEADAIDDLQKRILNIVRQEKPFDVFICYKEKDESGSRTKDSVIANDIYHQLTQAGLKVFFAAITLEDKLGQEYEPYIYAALTSAKVMLVLGTQRSYFEATWVRNEWSRFLKQMKQDRSKLLIPCYRDMDAYDLPTEFAHLQAQDMSKIAFMTDLLRGIEKICKKPEPAKQEVKAQPVAATANAATQTDPLVRRLFLLLEDGKWDDADDCCEKILDANPECAEAYLGKLMISCNLNQPDELCQLENPFWNDADYKKVLRFGSDKLKAQMEEQVLEWYYWEGIHISQDAQKMDFGTDFDIAMQRITEAEGKYEQAKKCFDSIPGYKDADMRSEACATMIYYTRRDYVYDFANVCAANGHEDFALEKFLELGEWKDASLCATAILLDKIGIECDNWHFREAHKWVDRIPNGKEAENKMGEWVIEKATASLKEGEIEIALGSLWVVPAGPAYAEPIKDLVFRCAEKLQPESNYEFDLDILNRYKFTDEKTVNYVMERLNDGVENAETVLNCMNRLIECSVAQDRLNQTIFCYAEKFRYDNANASLKLLDRIPDYEGAKQLMESIQNDINAQKAREAEEKKQRAATKKAKEEAEARAKAAEAQQRARQEKNRGTVQALIISILSLAAAGWLFYYVENIIDDGVLTPVFSLLWILYTTVALWFFYKKCAKEYRRLPRLILCGTLIAHIAIKYTLDQAWAEMPIGSTILAVFLAGWAILLIWGHAYLHWDK